MEQIIYLQDELTSITQIMQENVQKIISQQIIIDELDEKTLLLVEQSQDFKSRSSNLKRHLWWAKHKIPIILGSVLTTSTLTTAAFLLL